MGWIASTLALLTTMNRNRTICLSGLALCLLVGGYLRLAGYDWGYDRLPESQFNEQGGYTHPDERSVYGKAGGLRWDVVDRAEGESWWAYQARAAKQRFLAKESGLNINSFNYGSFPYYVLLFVSWLGNSYNWLQAILPFLILGLFALSLRFSILYFRARNEGRGAPWGAFIVETIGAAVVLAGLAYGFSRLFQPLDPQQRFVWDYGSWARIGRPMSAIAGTLTILYVYRIGARLFGRRVGLLGAIFLSFTVLHIQLSHFFTFDVIQAFFTTASMYSLLVLVDAETWGRRWRAAILAAVWAGLGLATKFGSILLFIPWVVAFWVVWFRHRPCMAWYRLGSLGFAAHLKLLAPVSFATVWLTAFAAMPFGFLDFEPRTNQPQLSFVHFDTAPKPDSKGLGLQAWTAVNRLTTAVNPYTSKVGVHFTPLLHPEHRRGFEGRLTIGGGKHWADVDEQRRMATMGGGVVWTRQYTNTTPFLYQWHNLFFWGMGPPLALVCLLGVAYGLGRPWWRPTWKEWVVWAWVAPSFFTVMLFHTKFPRYLAPILPFLCLYGACWTIAAYRELSRRCCPGSPGPRYAVALLAVAAIVWSAAYSFSFIKIYTEPHVWAVAGQWFKDNVEPGKSIITEQWDDGVPWDGRIGRDYQPLSTTPVHGDDPGNLRGIARTMARGDYYAFSSKRNYGSFLQTPETSPNRILWVKSLFAGQLGYRLEKTFSKPTYVFGIPIRFELADESLSLYDRPTVHVFKRVDKLKADEIMERMSNPPGWVREISKEDVLTSTEDRPLFAPRTHGALPRWTVGLALLGWALWPIAFFLFRGSRDGGVFASKTLAITLLTYLSWFGSSTGWWVNERWATSVAFAALALGSVLVAMRMRRELGAFLRSRWETVVASEVLFWIVFAFFLSIRASNPDINWGEKEMDASFVSAAYQTKTFPAMDPWYAGVPINYYYYGHIIVGLFGKWVGVAPEFAYNLACATWPAMLFSVICGLVWNLSGSRLGGLIGGFLAIFAGNGKVFFQLAANLSGSGGTADPKVFRDTYPADGGLSGYFADVWEQVQSAFLLTGQILTHVWHAVLAAWNPAYLTEDQTRELAQLTGFDTFFWKLSRISRSSVACEFPAWTVTFADLHAHMLVMPIGALTISLIAAFCKRKAEVWKARACANNWADDSALGGRTTTIAQVVVIGLLLGVVSCTNTWDLPGLFGFFVVATTVLLICHRREYFAANKWSLGRGVVGVGLWGKRFRQILWWKLAFIREVVIPVVMTFIVSRIVVYPFHQSFETPERVSGIGWMHQAACGWTTPYEFIQIFGGTPLLIVLGIVLLYWRWTAGEPRALGKAIVWIPLSIGTAALITLGLRALARKTFDPASLPQRPAQGNELAFWQYLDADIAYLVAGFVLALGFLLIPFLIRRRATIEDRLGVLILSMGLAIVAGVEIVHIREGWGAPGHRYNTQFKFHLQAWIVLAIGCGWLVGVWMRRPEGVPPVAARVVGRVCRYGVGYPLGAACLLFAGLFPLMAPFIFSQSGGFDFRTRHLGAVRTVDGLAFQRVAKPDTMAAIDWLRRFVDGTPVTVEAVGGHYDHDRSLFSSHTGLPTLIGWPHHSGERGNAQQPPQEELKALYTSIDRERVREELSQNNVRYVVLGPIERGTYSAGGGRGLEKFEAWIDLFRPAFRSNIDPPGVTIYEVNPSYELKELGEAETPQTKTLFVEDTGAPLFRGREGMQPGEFREPRAITVGPDGRFFVADTMNHRVQIYDERGNFKAWVGEKGEDAASFNEPNDLDLDESGSLYVLDTWNSRLQIFSSTGEMIAVHAFSSFGPRGIAVGGAPVARESGAEWVVDATATPTDKRIYIANTGAKNILVFGMDGKQLAAWGTSNPNGEPLGEPVDVEVTPLGLAVTDARHQRIVFLDGSGRWIREWKLPTESTGGTTNEMHLDWDAVRRKLVVSDPEHDRLFILDDQGTVTQEISMPGRPTGVAFDAEGKLYVTLRQSHRVSISPVSVR